MRGATAAVQRLRQPTARALPSALSFLPSCPLAPPLYHPSPLAHHPLPPLSCPVLPCSVLSFAEFKAMCALQPNVMRPLMLNVSEMIAAAGPDA